MECRSSTGVLSPSGHLCSSSACNCSPAASRPKQFSSRAWRPPHARVRVCQAYSPLGDNSTELIAGPLVSSIGAAHNKSGAQVALRWIWQNGVAVTTKATKQLYLEEDIDLFDWELTADEMTKTNAATSPAGTPSFMCNA